MSHWLKVQYWWKWLCEYKVSVLKRISLWVYVACTVTLVVSDMHENWCFTSHRRRHWHGRPQDFFQGWAMRGLKDGSPPAQSRGSSPVGVWGQSPQKLTTFSQNDANTSSTELLDNICSKKLFNISGGQVPPLPLGGKCPPSLACGRPWSLEIMADRVKRRNGCSDS